MHLSRSLSRMTTLWKRATKIHARFRLILDPLCTAGSIYVAARVGHFFLVDGSRASPVWFPSAFALASTFWFGPHVASIGVFIGSLLNTIHVYYTKESYYKHASFMHLSPLFALNNMMEAIVGHCLVRLACRGEEKWFETTKGTFAFFAPLPLAPLVSACIAAAVMRWGNVSNTTEMHRLAAESWLGRLSALYALCPILLQPLPFGKRAREIPLMQVLRYAGTYAVLALLASFVFTDGWGLRLYTVSRALLFPSSGVAILAALMLDSRGTAVGTLIVTIACLMGTHRGQGPFDGHWSSASDMYWFVAQQAFVCTLTGVAACVAGSVSKRNKMRLQLQDTNDALESQVNNRTSEYNAAKDASDAASHQKNEFLRRVGKEVRVPIEGILALSRKILATDEMDANGTERLRILGDSASQLLEILTGIEDVSAAESGRLCTDNLQFNPVETLQTASRVLHAGAAAKGITFDFVQHEDVPLFVDGDLSKIRQCLVCMIDDCITECIPNGTITLRVKLLGPARSPDGSVHVNIMSVRLRNYIRLAFAVYLPGTELECKWSSVQVGTVGEGVGQISASIADLDAEYSRSETGSVRLAVPVRQALANAEVSRRYLPDRASTEIERPERSLSLLLYEENELYRRMAYEQIQKAGHITEVVRHTNETLVILTKGTLQSTYDMLLIDTTPAGLELVRQIRAYKTNSGGPRVPIVGLSRPGESVDWKAAGIDLCLDVPFTARQIMMTIKTAGF